MSSLGEINHVLMGEINHVLIGGDKSCPYWGR